MARFCITSRDCSTWEHLGDYVPSCLWGFGSSTSIPENRTATPRVSNGTDVGSGSACCVAPCYADSLCGNGFLEWLWSGILGRCGSLCIAPFGSIHLREPSGSTRRSNRTTRDLINSIEHYSISAPGSIDVIRWGFHCGRLGRLGDFGWREWDAPILWNDDAPCGDWDSVDCGCAGSGNVFQIGNTAKCSNRHY